MIYFFFDFRIYRADFEKKPKNLKIWLIFKKNLKNDFSEKGHKIPMRRPPTEISGDPLFFYQKLVENKFRGQGPPIDDLGPLFQKSKPEI